MVRRTAITRFNSNCEFSPYSDLNQLTLEELRDAERLEELEKSHLIEELKIWEENHSDIFQEYWDIMDGIEEVEHRIDKIIKAKLAEIRNSIRG